VRFRCGQCGRTLDVADAQPGQEIACPGCGHQVPVPPAQAEEDIVLTPERLAGADEDGGFASMARHAMSRKIRFTCGACGRNLEVALHLAGRKARCPACKASIRVPFPDEGHEAVLERLTQGTPPPETDEAAVLAQLADQAVPEGQIEMPPEAPPETFPEVLPEGLDLAAEFAEFAQSAQPPAKRNRLVNLAALLTAGLLLAAIFAVGLWYGLRGAPGPKTAPPVAPSPSPRQTPVASAPRSAPVPPPPAVPPFKVDLAGVLPEVIPHTGFFPAGATRVYWNVKLLVQAGEKPVELRTGDIVLRAGEWEYPCLGVPGGNETPLPRLAREATLSVGQRVPTAVTVLFDVPATLRAAQVVVAGAPPLATGPVELPALPEDATPEGLWAESPPRNLQPLLRDAVMAAIQSAGDHELRIRREGKLLIVEIPDASVTGRAEERGGGLFDATLRKGNHSLNAVLRLVGPGDRMVLYLRDEPFHQIVYVRK